MSLNAGLHAASLLRGRSFSFRTNSLTLPTADLSRRAFTEPKAGVTGFQESGASNLSYPSVMIEMASLPEDKEDNAGLIRKYFLKAKPYLISPSLSRYGSVHAHAMLLTRVSGNL